ncbi:hypothetical protein ACWDFH_01290 [Streptomyces kronopolitis]|uniref:hypothetical protein n=1 Tax=Streptomyces kronopolitis TaxID=1612435 RepID=UPI0036886893
MDDHGDDFGRWLGEQHPEAVQRTEEEWEQIARYVCHAANKIGPALRSAFRVRPRNAGAPLNNMCCPGRRR